MKTQDQRSEIAATIAAVIQTLKVRERREGGLPPDKAHYAAQPEFGNTLLLKEGGRDKWGWNSFEQLIQDACDELRLLVCQGKIPALIGAVVGIVGALALTHLMSGLLYGVRHICAHAATLSSMATLQDTNILRFISISFRLM